VLLGSSASELTRRVTIPITVIRDVADDARARAVVIGVDGSTPGARAARAGFDFAARRRLRVVAVHAWSDLPLEALGIRADVDSMSGREDGAALLVVGRRGRARTADMPLRSVCHADVHYAPCPVLIIR
jgi:nucleotide-binding universal stress UspA family protein